MTQEYQGTGGKIISNVTRNGINENKEELTS